MPYTPPSQRSPATSIPSSPVITRSQFVEPSPQQQTDRPGLPRSRSATYLHKHRRSPSLLESTQTQEAAHHGMNGHHPHFLIHHHGHDRKAASDKDRASQVLPDLIIPGEGSTASPSESMGSEEEDDRLRGRNLEALADRLRATVVTKRGRSPPRLEEDNTPAAPRPTPALETSNISSPRLTPEALKITHSRSTSAIELSQYNTDVIPVILGSSDSDDGDEEDLHMKPPLIRKKSGELVKPALRPTNYRRRPSSMPGTPTYSKAVHFREEIEQVRHFLQVDRPMAVSAGTSPAENYDSETEYPFGGAKARSVEWEIRTANFPRDTIERLSQPVRVEKLFLSSDNKTLIGNVAVANISFHKSVVARFTLDYWNTTSEVTAEYNNDVRKKLANDGFDRFNFNIKLADQAKLESKTLLLCVRYNVEGHEYWDNNNSMNYQVDFVKKIVSKPVSRQVSIQGFPGSSLNNAIPRSRRSPLSRPRSFPAGSDDDFSQGFGFDNEETVLRDPPTVIKLRNKPPRKGSVFPDAARSQVGLAFSTRYDFGASLTAALQNAQNVLGDQSGIKPKSAPVTPAKSSAPAVQPVQGRPDKISSDRPDLHSAEYNDLIQKFCYFGSGGKSSPAGVSSPLPINEKLVVDTSAGHPNGLPQADGSTAVPDSTSSSPGGSPLSSASNSPPSPRQHSFQLDGSSGDYHHNSNVRSTTPPFHPISPRLLPYRSPSPGLGSSYQDYPFQGLAPQSAQC